jgi:hypothetical protein
MPLHGHHEQLQVQAQLDQRQEQGISHAHSLAPDELLIAVSPSCTRHVRHSCYPYCTHFIVTHFYCCCCTQPCTFCGGQAHPLLPTRHLPRLPGISSVKPHNKMHLWCCAVAVFEYVQVHSTVGTRKGKGSRALSLAPNESDAAHELMARPMPPPTCCLR